eukprot:scaffold1439_cov404-Prasinococcus_capsulatus_cf.AAC.7
MGLDLIDAREAKAGPPVTGRELAACPLDFELNLLARDLAGNVDGFLERHLAELGDVVVVHRERGERHPIAVALQCLRQGKGTLVLDVVVA